MEVKIPSLLYYVALAVWPFVTFKLLKKYSLDTGLILCFVLAHLLLPMPPFPAPLDLPLLPPFDKALVPLASIFLYLKLNKLPLQYFPSNKLIALCLVLLLLSPILTYLTNRDAIVLPAVTLPGIEFPTAISNSLENAIRYLFVFAIGYTFLVTDESHKKIVQVIAISGLFYAILMLYEVRMSPQLHTHIYGFFPHEWGQQKREGGFRPVVFLGHGLHTAFFAMMTLCCLYVMTKAKDPLLKGRGWLFFTGMGIVLVLCKTYSALIYFVLFFVTFLFFGAKKRTLIYSAMVAVILIYPIVRTGGVIPFSDITAMVEDINPERAQSLQFRFDNEQLLVDRASERPLFGWGGWGRTHYYSERTGDKLTVADGYWIVTFAGSGWVGYFGLFGVLGLPIFAVRRLIKRQQDVGASDYTLVLVCILAIMLFNQIPNASVDHLTLLIAGSLAGWVQSKKRQDKRSVPRKEKEAEPQST